MKKVEGSGPLTAQLLIVGEAPGEQEEAKGVPFIGPAGQALRKWMMECGLSPDSVRFENLCKYRPPGNKLRSWTPSGKANQLVLESFMQLGDTIEQMPNLNLILALGSFPLYFLTGRGHWDPKPEIRSYVGIQEFRGYTYPCILNKDIKVLPTFHPSYLIQEGMGDHGTFLSDLHKAREQMQFKDFRYPKREYFDGPEGHDKLLCRQRLLDTPKDQPLTTDIEYILNKKTGKARLICVGITNSKHWSASFKTDTPSEIDFVREIFSHGHPINAQNSMFDCSILEWHYKIAIQKQLAFDTMIAAHAANIELPKDLGYLGSIYQNVPYWKDAVNWKRIIAGLDSIQTVYHYNNNDCMNQHEIMEEQIKYDLNDKKVREVFEFEMAMLDPLWEISKRGMRLDHTLLAKANKDFDAEILALGHLLNVLSGRVVNVKSGSDMAWLIHEHLALPMTRKTKKGAPKTDDKTLAAYLVKCKEPKQEAVLNLVRDIRNKRDLKSKFFNAPLDSDGRSRGHYDPSKTRTGRLASKKFFPTDRGHQQQNIPGAKSVKRCFIPDEGKEFGYADLERAESLVVAHLTNDPVMLAHHAPGTDAHRALASRLFSKPEEEITADQRYLGKQTRHAGNYMEGPETMKMNINQKAHLTGVSVTYADCDKFIKIYRSMHRFLQPWWLSVEQQLWRDRTLYNLLGRRRIFYDHIKGIVPQAVAYIPQSTIGDTLNCGLLAVHGIVVDYMQDHLTMTPAEIRELAATMKHDWGFEVLNQVHDAVGHQYWSQYRFEVNSSLRKLLAFRLQNPKTYEDFIVPVETLVGPNWGDVKKWEEDMVAHA